MKNRILRDPMVSNVTHRRRGKSVVNNVGGRTSDHDLCVFLCTGGRVVMGLSCHDPHRDSNIP